ncbi:hypothetical protein A306_00011963 [Columba livia]|uniref:Protein lin-7 homolog A n=1 Tax=Columba livia TaxID=8932 RepID=A0A2I0LUY4_COLLI|nr:hypothetical protein A306_00011963 [Columba livia]
MQAFMSKPTRFNVSSIAEEGLGMGNSWDSLTLDPEVSKANAYGFTGCMSSVQYNHIAPLKAALRHPSVAPVTVKGSLTESSCASIMEADVNTVTAIYSSSDVARAIELLEKLQESGEVPVHKLQSLKKVLQSEFCTAIREVYQYMHETITVNGCPEFRARATAKATVAAFAASEGHSHPRVVELPKTDEGLGFNVMGGKEQNSPIYISRIIPGGVAERHGGLKRGDQLLSVNGVSVEGEHHEKAVELLKAAKDSVKLVVRYTPKVLEEMEARFEKLRTARRRQQQQLLIQQQQQQQTTQQNHMSLFSRKKKPRPRVQ